jgi:hypothetical protein
MVMAAHYWRLGRKGTKKFRRLGMNTAEPLVAPHHGVSERAIPVGQASSLTSIWTKVFLYKAIRL